MQQHRVWRRLSRVAIAGACSLMIAAGGAAQLRAAFGDSRTLAIYNIHTKETTTVLYKKDGKWVPGAKDKLDWAMRDWRRDEKTAMDPELYDLLWDMHRELGSKEPIHLISAFRSRGTNEMLRKTVGGQASESRHILGKAADVHFPDVELKQLRYSALIRERGGVGYYPTSALPFIHVDTDRVRHWPRLPRHELALLFPDGKTQHQPADGGPISSDDVRAARAKHRDLATQVAAFHDLRRNPRPAIAVAELPSAPIGKAQVAIATPPAAAVLALREPPRVVDRPSRLTGPSVADRQQLTSLMQLASLDQPRLLAPPQPARRPAGPQVAAIDPRAPIAGAPPLVTSDAPQPVFVAAPAFDDEHPEELSYRPFPIAPLLTVTPSTNDPALAMLQAPDVSETLRLLDQEGGVPPMRLRPNQQVAAMLWAQQFSGYAVPATMHTEPPTRSSGIAERRVPTARR